MEADELGRWNKLANAAKAAGTSRKQRDLKRSKALPWYIKVNQPEAIEKGLQVQVTFHRVYIWYLKAKVIVKAIQYFLKP